MNYSSAGLLSKQISQSTFAYEMYRSYESAPQTASNAPILCFMEALYQESRAP